MPVSGVMSGATPEIVFYRKLDSTCLRRDVEDCTRGFAFGGMRSPFVSSAKGAASFLALGNAQGTKHTE